MRARAVVALALGLVAVAGVVALGLMLRDERVYSCRDVGLEGPLAATPEEAIDAFAVLKGGDGADWEALGDDTFAPRGGLPELLGFGQLGVDEVQPGTWQVAGGCVGPV